MLLDRPVIKEKKEEKKEEKAEEKRVEEIVNTTERVLNQQLAKQENKTISAGKEIKAIELKGSGFIQSLIIRWSHASQDVSDITIQLDLGRHGSYTADFNEYYTSGLTLPHSAQDFWVSQKDDTNYKYALTLAPAIPLEYKDGVRVNFKNTTALPITLEIARIKFYTEEFFKKT